jgi:hypothetical protein
MRHCVNQLLPRRSQCHRRQEGVGRLRLSISPFDKQPEFFSFTGWTCWVIESRHHPAHCESRSQVPVGSSSPSRMPKFTFEFVLRRQVAQRNTLFVQPSFLDEPHGGLGIDTDSVVDAQLADAVTCARRHQGCPSHTLRTTHVDRGARAHHRSVPRTLQSRCALRAHHVRHELGRSWSNLPRNPESTTDPKLSNDTTLRCSRSPQNSDAVVLRRGGKTPVHAADFRHARLVATLRV